MSTLQSIPVFPDSFQASYQAKVSEIRTCPTCATRCENRGDNLSEDWFTAETSAWLPEAGIGPDKVWYCSGSCRMQEMFQAVTPKQREAFTELAYTLSRLDSIAKNLGFLIPENPLRQWGFDEIAMHEFLIAGNKLYKAMHGTADNEQPAFMYDAENGEAQNANLDALRAAEQILKRSPMVNTNDGGKFRTVTTISSLKEVRAAIAAQVGGAQ